MNLREIASGKPSLKVLQAKLQQQNRQIQQMKEENSWLRERLAKATEQPDKKQQSFFKRK